MIKDFNNKETIETIEAMSKYIDDCITYLKARPKVVKYGAYFPLDFVGVFEELVRYRFRELIIQFETDGIYENKNIYTTREYSIQRSIEDELKGIESNVYPVTKYSNGGLDYLEYLADNGVNYDINNFYDDIKNIGSVFGYKD